MVPLRGGMHTKGFLAGGLETKDLVGNVAPRRLHSHNLIMERVSFVKTFDYHCVNNWRNTSEDLTKYRQLCMGVLQEGLQRWGEEMLRDFLNSPILMEIMKQNLGVPNMDETYRDLCLKDPSCTLLQLLYEIFSLHVSTEQAESWRIDVANLISGKQEALERDKLWNASWAERPMKPLMELALEYSSGHYYYYCALGAPRVYTIKQARSYQVTHPLIDVEWTLAAPDVSEATAQRAQENNIITMKFDVESGEALPDGEDGFDSLYLDRVLSRKLDIPRYLENMKKLMRDDSFAIICEVTRHYELSATLEAFKPSLVEGSGDGLRFHGLYFSHEQWMELFTNAGFRVVAIQTDPSFLTTTYALHKPPVNLPKPHFVSIDDMENFGWIDTLKTLIPEKVGGTENNTIWLTSTSIRDNGGIGLARSFREEYPAQSTFRILNDVSLKNRDGPPVLTLDHPEVKKRVDNDMFENCYRDGEWGGLFGFCATEGKLLFLRILIYRISSNGSLKRRHSVGFYSKKYG